LGEWETFTPDGRRLAVTREREAWTVVCGEGDEARSALLDVALIEAIRREADVLSHSFGVDYGAWTRALADRIEREHEALDDERPSALIPDRGDRIELLDRRLGVSVRGTVQHVDRIQILVKWDDDRSGSLRVGIDPFRIIS
jgi:hypothetical protein